MESPIEILTLSDGRKVYSFFEENEITNQDKVVNSLQDAFKENEFLINETGLKKGDYVVITASAPNLITGRTNFVRVHKIGT